MQLAEMYNEAKKFNARINMYNIGFASAATLAENVQGPYGIFIDFSACKTLADISSNLAHEFGHCATGALHSINSPYEIVERNEHRANKWAVTKYLPFNEIKAAMQYGYTEAWQLAEYFDVQEIFIKKALSYYVDNMGLDFNI